MSESQEHQAFCKWLDKNQIPFVHSRTDRKHTNAVGDPDFFCFLAGRVLGLEMKVGRNKLSPAQEKRIAYLRKAGNSVTIVQDCASAISAVQTWLGVESAEIQSQVKLEGAFLERSRAPDLWIGSLFGTDYVFRGSSVAGSTAEKLRQATPEDIRNLPRR